MMTTLEPTLAVAAASETPWVDRRSHERMPAAANTANLEWWQGGSYRSSAARLVDISEGGAMLVAEQIPSLSQDLWLRLEGPVETHWIGGQVVRVAGTHDMAIAFDRPCPRDFFESAVLGISFGHIL